MFSKITKKINRHMYIDDIKIFAKSEKELETRMQNIRIYSEDIGMQFGIVKCLMLIIKSGKRDGTELLYRKSIKNPGRERKLRVFENIVSRHYQTTRNERETK